MQISISVARTVLAGRLWLFLPPWEEPMVGKRSASDESSSGSSSSSSSNTTNSASSENDACRAPPLFSGPAYTGSASAIHGGAGRGSSNSGSSSVERGSCAGGSISRQQHSPFDVWRVGVAVGNAGGVLVVEWQ